MPGKHPKPEAFYQTRGETPKPSWKTLWKDLTPLRFPKVNPLVCYPRAPQEPIPQEVVQSRGLITAPALGITRVPSSFRLKIRHQSGIASTSGRNIGVFPFSITSKPHLWLTIYYIGSYGPPYGLGQFLYLINCNNLNSEVLWSLNATSFPSSPEPTA